MYNDANAFRKSTNVVPLCNTGERLLFMKRSIRLLGALLTSLLLTTVAVHARSKPRFNAHGNLLITDRDNNRVIEIDTNTQTIVWEYDMSVRRSVTNLIVGPCDAERFHSDTLIVGGGLTAGASMNYPSGAADNRVIMVNRKGKIIWQYGQEGVTGSGEDELNNPVAAMMLRHRDVLITDQGNHRVIQVNRGKKIVWQYGTTGVSGSASNQLNSPASAERLVNGDYLIADAGNNRVIEVSKKGALVRQYGDPLDTSILNGPTYICRVPGGNFLITDSLNNRIIEIDDNSSNVFTYVTSTRSGSVTDPQPTHALQLKKGNYLIADQFNHQVVEINPAGDVVFTYGTLGVPGDDDGFLNAPCDVKVIGDYTGLTSLSGNGGSGFSFGGF
jgi:outer membrane protein assembly factor BamB